MLGFFVSGTTAWALQQVQIQEVSDSKKSIIINRGQLEDIQLGMRAFFLKAVSPTTFQMVGQARVAKVFERRSMWYFIQTVNPEYLLAKGLLNILTQQDALKGRASFKIIRHQKVRLRRDRTQNPQLHRSGRDQKIVKRSSEYYEVNLPLAEAEEADGRYDIFDLAEWTERQATMENGEAVLEVHAQPLEQGPLSGDRRQALQAKQHLELAQHLVNQAQRGALSVSEQTSQPPASVLVDPLKEHFGSSDVRPLEEFRDIEGPGENDWQIQSQAGWKKQVEPFQQFSANELSFILIRNMTDTNSPSASTLEDPSPNPVSYGIGYEYLGKQGPSVLSKIAPAISLYVGNNNYDLIGEVRTREFFGQISGHFYFLDRPGVGHRPMPFTGFGIKAGLTDTIIRKVEYGYQLFGLLGHLGIKYRFQNFAIRAVGNLERVRLSQTTGPQNQGVLQIVNVTYFSLAMGLSYFF